MSPTDKFCKAVEVGKKSTSQVYASRLRTFDSFLRSKYNIPLDSFFDQKFDVYEVLADYHTYLSSDGLKKSTISAKIATARLFLEYNGVAISGAIFRLRVRPPKATQGKKKKPLTKDLARKIILACKDMRLQTYTLLLAATGMRAQEALSIRLKDIDFANHKISLRAEFTKTDTDRDALVTDECMTQLKKWKEYRERERRIVTPSQDNGKSRIENVTRILKPTDLFFSTGHHVGVKNPRNLYHILVAQFDVVLDANGFDELEENTKAKRHKITLHSFRRFVKTTVSKLAGQEYSEWFIGHKGSTYFTEHEDEAFETLHKIESNLTYLDYSKLDKQALDVNTQLIEKDNRISQLEKQMESYKQSHDEIQILRQEMFRLKKAVEEQLKEKALGEYDGYIRQ